MGLKGNYSISARGITFRVPIPDALHEEIENCTACHLGAFFYGFFHPFKKLKLVFCTRHERRLDYIFDTFYLKHLKDTPYSGAMDHD